MRITSIPGFYDSREASRGEEFDREGERVARRGAHPPCGGLLWFFGIAAREKGM